MIRDVGRFVTLQVTAHDLHHRDGMTAESKQTSRRQHS